jgi:predicted Zn finger-like uncharacterized protein
MPREARAMSMVTQCPECGTAFNVTPEQLFVRDGRVRCGQCKSVFDGLVNLTSLEALQAGDPPPLAEAEQKRLTEMPAPARPLAANGFSPLNWPMLPDVPAVPVPPLPLEISAPAAQTLADFPDRPKPRPAPAQKPKLTVSTVQEQEPEYETQTAPRRSWPWAIAATLALMALCAQALYAFRSEAAAHFPRAKPMLAEACEWLRCRVHTLQRPSALTIQASDLLIRDTERPHLVQLVVTLQNQSTLNVGYPAIDLSLNDRFDHVVARRVLLPKDYLRGDASDARDAVIAASVVTTIRVNLDVSGLTAGGFGLLLIPAPDNV